MFSKIVSIAIAVLLGVNIALFAVNAVYKWEVKQMQKLMSKTDQRRLEAISTTQANRLALAIEMAHRMDQGDKDLHLSVETKKGIMALAREGAQLRDMNIRAGKEAFVGTRPDRVKLVMPLGKRLVINVADSNYEWTVPSWVYAERGQKAPTINTIKGGLGPLAIFLDSGTIIYSRPDIGPLNDANYVMPGSIRMATSDVEAIRKAIRPGMVVYFH